MEEKIKVGISSCLLGEKVRYDGGHKLDPFLVHTLGNYVEYIPVCPEVEAGFPIPREAFRLEGDPKFPRLVTRKTRIDHTDRMKTWADARLKELSGMDLCGFIFKSDSPSSGMERVKVYNNKGGAVKNGQGIFSGMFIERFPLLPVEEEGRLYDPLLRENFIIRIFAYHRWRQLLQGKPERGKLIDFHSRNKYLLMSHHPQKMREMGKLLAASGISLASMVEDYFRLLMTALKTLATVRKHTDVLLHMMGYFKKWLSMDEKAELLEVIEEYRRNLIPLIVPVTLLRHYVRKYDEPYLKMQVYLEPHPLELKLRNHA